MGDNYWGSSGGNYWGSSGSGDTYWGSSGGKSKGSDSDTKKEGTYGFEVSLWMTFYDEIKRLSNSINPPMFDGGKVTEQLGEGKYKVNLQGSKSVVTAEYGGEPFAPSYYHHKPFIQKGAYVLILIQSKNNVGYVSTIYTIQGIRQTGAYTPVPEEVEV